MKMIKSISTFVILVFTCMQLFASEPVKWSAPWIGHPTVEPESAAMILFRRNFELATKPERFVIHLSADNHYRLFVNGNYITRGPARGDIQHWFYETIDIAPQLKAGKNTIAVEVVNWGAKRSFSVFSQMTSFIMQGETDVESIVNTNDRDWKCYHNRAYSPNIVNWMMDRTSVDFGLYVAFQPENINGELYPWGWEKPEFDDSNWSAAQWMDKAATRNVTGSIGIVYAGAKLLVPRTVGMLREIKMPFYTIRRTDGIEKNENFIHQKGALTIPANRKVSILIDQNQHSAGYPEMLVSGGKGSRVQVSYSENMFVNNNSPRGDRNDIEGKRMIGIKDIFLPDGGENRLFKPSSIRTFRYIQLDIETKNDALTIADYQHVSSSAPIDLRAKFDASNALTDWIMEAGWRTVSICAQDLLMSDAYYEQLQYVGDSRVHNLSLLTLSGDDRLTRNFLTQVDQSRIPEGLTYAAYPAMFHLIIPSYSLMWIDQIHDYMMWKDDKAFIANFELGIESVLHWFERRMDKNGLLGKIEWWPAFAWPQGYKNGVSPGSVEGAGSTLYSLQYAYSLRHAADIFKFTGNKQMADLYQKRADTICKAVNKLCKNADGFYTESPTNQQVSQITNLLAIVAEASTGKEAKVLLNKLLEPKEWFGQVDLYLHVYLFEAMNKTNQREKFMPELSEWAYMKKLNLTTFVEEPLERVRRGDVRSECHPWSSAPNHFFFSTVCGIRPLSPGHRKVQISPAFGELNSINAVYPSALGDVKILLNKSKSDVSGTINIPEGMDASFSWEGQKVKLVTGENRIKQLE